MFDNIIRIFLCIWRTNSYNIFKNPLFIVFKTEQQRTYVAWVFQNNARV